MAMPRRVAETAMRTLINVEVTEMHFCHVFNEEKLNTEYDTGTLYEVTLI